MEKLKKIIWLLKNDGFINTLRLLNRKISTLKRLPNYKEIIQCFNHKFGLEIGGPSKFFNEKGPLPIYSVATHIDGVNYADKTVWTGKINKNEGYKINNKQLGNQYILDATNLIEIKRCSYDFVLSCNNLEHFANPLLAIEQWLKILKQGGFLLIIVPRKESNFDHRRKTTKFKHLLEDYKKKVQEDDLSHLSEILELHDLKLDPLAGTKENFRKRGLKNSKNRCFHHHVFNTNVMIKIFNYFHLSILKKITIYTDYVVLGRK